jgi:phosphoglycolate phosphatase
MTWMAATRTVIFDFDGTLADTLEPTLRACNRIAPEFGLRQVSHAELDTLRQMSARAVLRYLDVPWHQLPLLVGRVRQAVRQNMGSVRLFAGVPACLEQLHRGGIQLGVVTSNSRQNVRVCLQGAGVLPLFDFIHTSTHLFGKHRTLRRLLKQRGLAAQSVHYVGDQSHDVEAAHRSRVTAIAACWGYQSRESILTHRPDFMADTPADIARFVLG